MVLTSCLLDLDTMVGFVTEILEGKALCQQDPDQDDEEAGETEDQAEYDQVLISAASDLVAALASILGPDFSILFGTLFPLLSKYYVSGLCSCMRVLVNVSLVQEPLPK